MNYAIDITIVDRGKGDIMKKNVKRIILTITFGIVSIFISSIISFLISKIIPGDPVLAYLPEGHFNQAMYDQMSYQLGFNRPFFEQLLRYCSM